MNHFNGPSLWLRYGLTWIDQSPIPTLNITILIILVQVSQYFVSKISPACNLKINESPKTNLFCFLATRSTLHKNVVILPNPNQSIVCHSIMDAVSEDTLPIFYYKMLACHLQSPNMHIMFSLFLVKKKERLHGAYWNIELNTHFYDTINIILSSLNSKKINTSIFSIFNNRYL